MFHPTITGGGGGGRCRRRRCGSMLSLFLIRGDGTGVDNAK